MKKASRIVLLVGSIVGFVVAGILLLTGILFIIFGTPAFADIIREGIEKGTIHTDVSPETAVTIWQFTFLSNGILMVVIAIIMCLSGFFGLRARKLETKKAYIISIVFGAMMNEVNLVGSILGLIAWKRTENRKAKVVAEQE